MFACRSAWLRCGSLARTAAYRLPRGVLQQRQMSSIPGASGENIVYAVLGAGSLVGSLSYAYSTIVSDSTRYNDRIAELEARPKTEWTPKPWPPKGADEDEGGEAEEAVEEEAAPAEEEAESVDEGAAVPEEVAEAAAAAVEVPQVAEAVEEAAEPTPIAAEEPESNGTTVDDQAAASEA